MHSVSFVFDGNVVTITFHRCRLACAVPGVPFDWERAANANRRSCAASLQPHSQQGVAPDVVSHEWSCGAVSCGLVNLHPALAFLAECTANQPRQGKLHGVCLFDRILNPPSTALGDFPWRAWIVAADLVEGLR